MPLLSLETFLYPDDLLDGPRSVDAAGGLWWVLHVKPRAEKALARVCLARRLRFFLPLYRREWRHKDRNQTSFLPLFPGYLFIRGEDQDRIGALESGLVVSTLTVGDQTRLHEDLRRVHRLVNSNLLLTPEARLQPGDAVEIVRGPLAGLKGVVLRRGKNTRLVVDVSFLQQGASVELENWMIAALPGS
jgi:transcriptional antiterminator RfaH